MQRWNRALLLPFVILPLVAAEARPPDSPGVPREFISASLTPETHRIAATAVAVLPVPENRTLEFALNAKLDFVAVNSVSIGGKELTVPLETGRTEGAIRWHSLRLPESVAPGARAALTLTYSGVIYDPVKTANDLTFVVGDSTTGLIGNEGIYLVGETGWYPVLKSPLALYELRVKAPAPWEIVSQGELRSRTTAAGENQFYYASDVPADSLALVGGKYDVQTADAGGVKVSTYFFADEKGIAPLYLNAVTGYLKRFSNLLGPYPYKKFDVVENFFETGYGFPSFTLLGNDVIKMGERALRPGYLDHELVHDWYGNGLFFDPAKGNWVEGLTTYIANYLGNEAQGPEAARRYRLGMSQKYSLRVKPEKDYPLRKFEGKTEDFENDIGYSKAAMVFHMLRRLEGDDAFFGVLKDFTQSHIGQVVTWEDFRAVYEEALGADLGWLFDDWLDRPGLPELALEGLSATPEGSGFAVRGTIAQKSEKPYRLPLAVRVTMESGASQDFGVWLDSAATPFEFRVAAKPARIQLDPDYNILRRLSNDEMPPSLNAVLDSGKLLIVMPTHASDAAKAIYQKVADRAKGARDGAVVLDSSVMRSDPETHDILALGSPAENAVSAQLLAHTDFAAAGDDSGRSVLVSMRPTKTTFATVFYGNSVAALARANYIFYYGWDSYVVINKGVPADRRVYEPTDTPTDRPLSVGATVPAAGQSAPAPEGPSDKEKFDRAAAALGISADQLRADVTELASPKYKGRFAADPTHFEALKYIKSRLDGMVAESAARDRWRVRDDGAWGIVTNRIVGEPNVWFMDAGVRKTIPVLPFIFDAVVSNSTAWEIGTTGMTNYGGHLQALRYVGAGLSDSDYAGMEDLDTVVIEDAPAQVAAPLDDPSGSRTLFEQVRLAREHNAIAAIILRDPNQTSFSPYYLAYPNRLPAGEDEKIKKLKDEGRFFGVEQYLRSIQSRLPYPPFEVDLSAVSATREDFLAAVPQYAAWRSGAAVDRFIKLDSSDAAISLRLAVHDFQGANLVATVAPTDYGRTPTGPAVLIGAHYDHLGYNNNGEMMPGAVDNASGVAALLAIAEYFATHTQEVKGRLTFAFFDMEEWGLIGSSVYASRLYEGQPRLVLNLDSLGAGKEDTMYLIGRTHEPEIVPLVEKSLNDYGIALAPDIDKYAFQFGSDFYSFYEKGIPAVGFFDAQYHEIHKPTDTVDKVNFERLARESAALIELIKELMNH